MKTNKFRVWDVKFEDMFDADNIILDRNDSLSNQINDCDKYKFMQFTGLLDMNGKEVYEKDILKVRVGWDDWKTAPLLVDNLWDIYIFVLMKVVCTKGLTPSKLLGIYTKIPN